MHGDSTPGLGAGKMSKELVQKESMHEAETVAKQMRERVSLAGAPPHTPRHPNSVPDPERGRPQTSSGHSLLCKW
jgi:hypothetical protein